MKTTRQHWYLGKGRGLLIGCISLLFLAGCGDNSTPKVTPPPPKVTVAAASKQKIPMILPYSGTIKAVKSVDIIPRVSGYIEKRIFEEGTFVKKDDPLYLIDPRTFQATLDGRVAQLKSDKASLVYWKSEAARYTRLAKKGAASREKKEGALTKLNETIADIEKDKAEIESASLQLGFTNITAPFSGRIQQTLINEGNLVQAQRDVLTTLVQMDPIYVTFSISRREVYNIQGLKRKGEAFLAKDMIVELILPDGSLYSEKGKINFISFAIDPTTDSVNVRAIFPNKSEGQTDFDLIPGQYTPVRLQIGENPDALLVPETAVVESQIGTNVFVVGKDNKVESRKVIAGSSYKKQRLITKGLKPGEQVIIEGIQKVRAGITVQPETPPSSKIMTKTDAKTS